jgi:DNA-binding MarR family transcriptional regulator
MMAFWRRLFKRQESRVEPTHPEASDRELVKRWVQSINDSVVQIRRELQKIPSLTVAALDESFEDRTHDVLSKLDALPEKIIGPLGEIIDLSKREVLAELVRISSRYGAHDSHDSVSALRQKETSIQEITKELTGKQRRLLAILLDSGFLSYAEIGEKLGITHESAKNLVNRLLKDEEKARIFSKQETDRGIMVGVSSEVQDEILEKKYRTTPNDSP